MKQSLESIAELVSPKSIPEIIEKLSEMIHRYRRRYIQSFLRPCPNNCTLAQLSGNRVIGCSGCKSHNPEKCARSELYQPISTKTELSQEFKEILRDRECLQRDYPAIAVFLWVLGELDREALQENVIAEVEERR